VWTRPAPNDGLCPAQTGATLMSWSPVSSTPLEPFGELLSIPLPLGYHHYFQYNPAQESPSGATDYGLPTLVTGDSIAQQDQMTPTRTPTQLLSYDAYGDTLCRPIDRVACLG